MSIQYISDSKGKTAGVFIPISEWNKLKAKYKVIEDDHIEIPEWQKIEVRKRIQNTNTEDYLSWEQVEKELRIDK